MSERAAVNSQKTIRRRVQIVGGNTVTVSLPRTWADRNRLGRDPGEEQEVAMRYMADGSLLLSPANTTQAHIERIREHRITPQNSIDRIKRTIIGDFMGGIDVIKMRTKADLDMELVHQIRDFVDKRLLGFDLIEGPSGFDIINMTQSPKFAVDRLLEIIRVQSTQMMQKCYTWLLDESVDRKALYRELFFLESSLDKRSNQMIRTLQLSILDYWMAENVGLPMAEILYWSTTTKAAENAADLMVAISEIATTIDPSTIEQAVREEMNNLGELVTNLFSTALRSFIENDFEAAHQVMEEHDMLSAKTQKKWPITEFRALGGNMILLLRHMEKISVYARKIAEATIDCEAARVAYNSHDFD